LLERSVGKKVLVILDRDMGYEGELSAVSQHPPGIWLNNASAVVLRGTLANPIPQIIGREKRSELFIHLNSVLRVEVIATE
jgi:small nuclear ribonucleoprotein (snRNP)-like protein